MWQCIYPYTFPTSNKYYIFEFTLAIRFGILILAITRKLSQFWKERSLLSIISLFF